MADGPRCKRRKQANPRRNHVTNYNNVVEATSDSDDEDKLQIVEEDGTAVDRAQCDNMLLEDGLPKEYCWERAKQDCASDGEDDVSSSALVEEMLQQGDTAVIYPEAPEDEAPRQGTPDTGVHDENGVPDSFSQLLTCPYCARGYKRYSSLKEHIKYRHEKTEESFSCPECSYSFTYRAQLERHMTVHKGARDQRHITQSGGNRKFKCTECGKAFKYKHHLKEHLRIHSGEKPYECSNCKKRFSHSGSYSSHISSKKCISVFSANGRARLAGAKSAAQGPLPLPLLSTSPSLLPSKPLQEQLPLTQIKSEPVDYEYKPAVLTSPPNGLFCGGAAAPLQGAVQAVVLPTVGLVSPISINLADLQSALKVAVDSSIIRQVLENSNKVTGQVGPAANTGTLHTPQQQLISAISLPIVSQDGSAKIIINYSLDSSQSQLIAQNLKKEPEPDSPAQTTTDSLKCQKLPEDLTVRDWSDQIKSKEEKNIKTCLLCDNCPGGLEALHTLKHCMTDTLRLNGASLEKSESAVAALLTEGGPCSQSKNLLSLLKAYFALNREPTSEELVKISDSVSLPMHVVKRLFDKMQEGQISLGSPTPPSKEEDDCEAVGVVSLIPGKDFSSPRLTGSQDSPTEATPAEGSGSHSPAASPTPLNLTAVGTNPTSPSHSTEGPLDLSLPKLVQEEGGRLQAKAGIYSNPSHSCTRGEQPLNLTCTKKEASLLAATCASPTTGHASQTNAKPLEMVSTIQCLTALATNSKQTILIPQLAYTYTTKENSPAGTQMQDTIHLNGLKEERLDSEGLSTLEEQNDSDSGPQRKKMKTDSSMYACDLCDKIFQKSSSLLRHKYEHTGKRPHECNICSKAFKHKHHLIEHMRLHSGEKPYQCDKCGKRFSHSGSYSQHMNHRYSYCKKEMQSQSGGQEGPEEDTEAPAQIEALSQNPALHFGPSHLDSDERGSSTREDEESEEEEDEEERAVHIDDAQVGQIGNEGGEEVEGRNEQEVGRAVMEGGEEQSPETEVREEEEEADTRQEVPRSVQEEQEVRMEENKTMDMEEEVTEEGKAQGEVVEESGIETDSSMV